MKIHLNQPGPHRAVVVRFALPFCVHMKDDDYEVVHDGRRFTVQTEKVWRNSVDCVEDDTVYDEARLFPTGTVQTANVGGEPAEVRETGTNVELVNDPRGRFRYSRVAIGFMVSSGTDLGDESLFNTALAVANRFVDTYRYVSRRAYLPPVRSQDVDYIETIDVLTGEMVFTGNHAQGLQIALINESRAVQVEVRRRLDAGLDVPLHDEILLTAERMVLEGSPRHGAIDAVTALDVYLHETLHARLVATGRLAEEEFDHLLGGGRLGDWMKKPLELAIGWRVSMDEVLWSRWIKANGVRRDATHRGLSSHEAEEVIATVRDIIAEVDRRLT